MSIWRSPSWNWRLIFRRGKISCIIKIIFCTWNLLFYFLSSGLAMTSHLFALQKDYLKMMSFKANCMNSHMMISLLPSKKTWLWILQQFICWSLQAMIWFISQLSSHSSISAIRCILCSVYDKVRFSCGSEWKKGVDRRQSKIKGHPKKVVQKAF